MPDPIRHVAVVGGDPCAASVAAYVANSLRGTETRVTLIDDLSFPPRAASTLPATAQFYRALRFKEASLIGSTGATFKLGSEHTGWTPAGENFTLTYGEHGTPIRLLPFHQYFIRRKLDGIAAHFDDYSLAAAAIRAGTFELPGPRQNPLLPPYDYGIHADTRRFAGAMLHYALTAGVQHFNSVAVDATVRADDGFVEAVTLGNGERLAADFFIDCTGTRGLLIGDALDVPFESWSRYLPCNQVLAVASNETFDVAAVTRIAARHDGWSRRIQLADRAEFQLFFNNSTSSPDQIAAQFAADVRADIATVRNLGPIDAGQRDMAWRANCVAIGDSACRMEALETSALSRAHRSTMRLVSLWPDAECDPAIAVEYNRMTARDNGFALDYAALFYALGRRQDGAFWDLAGSLEPPARLVERLSLFRSRGRLDWDAEDTVSRDRWISALLGLQCLPEDCDPLVDLADASLVDQFMGQVTQVIEERLGQMPRHVAVLEQMRS